MSYKEIINETSIIQNEREILETLKSVSGSNSILNENYSIDDISNQINQVTERFKELFLESANRI